MVQSCLTICGKCASGRSEGTRHLDKGFLQVLNRPEAQSPLSGMGGFENGLVDLQMATEAFRDAFSATAPALEGPDSVQDFLLVEAYKSPANPITGVTRSRAYN